MRRSYLPFLVATAGALAVIGGPASAVDETKPAACNGLAFTDPAGDNGTDVVPTPATGTDLVGGFVKHDPAKGDQASTFNLIVKDLDVEVPPGYVTVSWIAYYPAKGEPTRWVRAVSDFGGGLAFEYGHIEDAVATTVSFYDGDIEGKIFDGADGVVQLVMPKGDVLDGDELKPVYATILQGQASLPPATGAPVRGTSWVMDSGPDDEEAANKTALVKPCPSGEPEPSPAPIPVPSVAPAPPPAPAQTGGAPAEPAPVTATPTGSRSLPVKLATRRIRARRGRTLALRVYSTEPTYLISAQLRRGTRLLGRGRIDSLDGGGVMRLRFTGKRARRLPRGRYVVDFAGNDSAGKRLLVSYALRVR